MISNSRKYFSVIFILLLAAVLTAFSQEEEQGRGGYAGGERIGQRGTTEVVAFAPHFLGIDSSNVRVDILYRVRYDFFVFTRDFSTTPVSFRARGELMIELTDSTDSSVSRKVQTILLRTADNETTQLRGKYFQGAATFTVHPGRYTLAYRVDDLESQRDIAPRRETIRVPRYKSQSLVRSGYLFVELPDSATTGREFTAVNDNNSSEFSRNTAVLLSVADTALIPSIHLSLTRMAPEVRDREVIVRDTTLRATLFPHQWPVLDPSDSGTGVHYTLQSTSTLSTVCFVLPTAPLDQGIYSAKIHFEGADTSAVEREFTVRWRDMPLSLTDLDFAVSAMRYITTDNEYDDLHSGNRANRIKKFEEFWKKRDQTPGTAYNEVMAEYFRRVDYAFVNFRTLKEENGVLTDRGKIYILYGKPTSIERSLAPGGPPREIWKYITLKKEFMFEDPSRQGNYILTATETR